MTGPQRVGRLAGRLGLAIGLAAFAHAASAVDLSTSGYGTLGYTRSDKPYTYQRFIDDRGTLKRDSVAGFQIDAVFAGNFGATLQGKVAAPAGRDDGVKTSVAWAFLTYRPNNDWLLRAGKQRIPLYLFSESYDIGVTYDFARLPTEMYSLTPANDAWGISFSKTWTIARADIVLDGYMGRSDTDFRFWLRDEVPQIQKAGAFFVPIVLQGAGLVLQYKSAQQSYRVGVHRARVKFGGPFVPPEFPFVPVASGLGYYKTVPALPGPELVALAEVFNTTWTVGAEVELSQKLRVVVEWAHSKLPEILAPQGQRGYVALLARAGPWTPYVSYAFLRSPSSALDIYDQVNGNRLPSAFPNAAVLNLAQRVGADQIVVFDQYTWAVGASYAFSATRKAKAEWSSTRIGRVSNLVDAAPGGDVRRQDINAVSLSYSFVF